MKNTVKDNEQNLYGACAYALLEDQQSSEPKVEVTLSITQELHKQLHSVGVVTAQRTFSKRK
ncbi:MAG: hypothetical protein ACRC7S_17440 [Cetobacterium sp.]